MNKKLTEIAYILDRSGSMNRMLEPAIAGFNNFLSQQMEAPEKARLSLFLFNDRLKAPYLSTPLERVEKLSRETYVPRGNTALLDAIGKSVTHIGERLADTPEEHRPGQVVVAIFTDGLENASRRFDRRTVAGMIRHQQEKYSWKFLFLAANQDAIAAAGRLGIAPEDAGNIEFSEAGMLTSSLAMSRKVNAMRHHAATGSVGGDFKTSMQDLVDAKEPLPERSPSSRGGTRSHTPSSGGSR